MDPLSVAGLGLGAVSLAFELFSGCVKGYDLFLEAKAMPESSRYLLARLSMEKEKLLAWACLVRIADGEETNLMKLHKHAVLDALREVQVLVLDLGELKKRYKLELVAATGNELTTANGNQPADKTVRLIHQLMRTPVDELQLTTPQHLRKEFLDIQEMALSFFSKTRKYPAKLRWAACDKKHFDSFLSRLGDLNDDMMGFLETYERKRHFQMQESTFMQILVLNNRVGDLVELCQSLKHTTRDGARDGSMSSTDEAQQNYEQRLIRLTRFKALGLAIENQSTPIHEPEARSLLDSAARSSRLTLKKLSDLCPNDDGFEEHPRSHAFYAGAPVWIEWRYYNSVEEDEGPPSLITQRISRLAKLLRDGMGPAEFLVPACRGYIVQKSHSRLGFVYASPDSLGRALPRSLLELLASPKPSLSTRVRIAREIATSLCYLHATNWLHKGLRSENVVFQDANQLRTASPFVCGFDYSRPSGLGEETERPPLDDLHKLYRHPNAQFDVPRDSFKKVYDIYSLGVVLFEIGVWKPVDKILGLDGRQRIRTSAIKGVRSKLPQEDSLQMFRDSVETCLDGASLLGEVTSGGGRMRWTAVCSSDLESLL